MTTSERVAIPAGHGKAARLSAGQSLKLINTHGTQVVDFWAFNAYDLREYMCVEASRVWSLHLWPSAGDTMVTNQRRPIVTLVEDTTPGIHDTIMAACDRQRYGLLGFTEYHRVGCAGADGAIVGSPRGIGPFRSRSAGGRSGNGDDTRASRPASLFARGRAVCQGRGAARSDGWAANRCRCRRGTAGS